jgi:glycerol kinase
VRLPQLARAALESVAFQVEDVVAEVHARHPVATLLADGGPTANPALMQLQADTSGRRVEVALARDLSALGAAHLAGIAVGVWDRVGLEGLERPSRTFAPQEGESERKCRIAAWHGAVARARLRADAVTA